jgi:hypothetical protein
MKQSNWPEKNYAERCALLGFKTRLDFIYTNKMNFHLFFMLIDMSVEKEGGLLFQVFNALVGAVCLLQST